jgi:hypothetical protein
MMEQRVGRGLWVFPEIVSRIETGMRVAMLCSAHAQVVQERTHSGFLHVRKASHVPRPIEKPIGIASLCQTVTHKMIQQVHPVAVDVGITRGIPRGSKIGAIATLRSVMSRASNSPGVCCIVECPNLDRRARQLWLTRRSQRRSHQQRPCPSRFTLDPVSHDWDEQGAPSSRNLLYCAAARLGRLSLKGTSGVRWKPKDLSAIKTLAGSRPSGSIYDHRAALGRATDSTKT